MNFESSITSSFRGLRILLVDNDTSSLLNIASTLEEHSFNVTTVELATVAMSILRERIDEFDLVMVDVNMLDMDCFEFMRSIQLIKDIPIILMSSMTTRDMVEEADAHGACFVLMKPISTKKLTNVWQFVYKHQIKKACQKPELIKANDHVEVMDEPSGANKKIQDRTEKKIVNSTDTYQEEGIMTLEKDEAKGSKRTRNTDEDHSLVSKNTMEGREKKRKRMEWTLDLDKKFKKAVDELGERARPKLILETMKAPHLTQKQVANHLQKYRTQKQQAQYVQPVTSSIVNQSQIMSQMPLPAVPVSHTQDGVNEGYHQCRFMREISTSLQEYHEEKQPLNVESTIGNLSSVFQRFPFHTRNNTLNHFPDNGHHFNLLNSNKVPMNVNEPLQEAYIPQPPAVPSLVPPNDHFAGLSGWNQDLELDHFNGEMRENQIGTYYNWLEKAPLSSSSTKDNSSTRNQNP